MKYILLLFCCLMYIGTSYAQTTYRKAVTIIAPKPNTINLASDNSTEYIAQQEITLKSGFEVKGANGTKYFLGKINTALSLSYIPQYSVLCKDLSSSYASTINGILYFTYEEKYQVGIPLSYKIYNYKRDQIIGLPALTITGLGSNFFQLDMNAILGTAAINQEEEAFYILEITNSKNEKVLLRFQYVLTTN